MNPMPLTKYSGNSIRVFRVTYSLAGSAPSDSTFISMMVIEPSGKNLATVGSISWRKKPPTVRPTIIDSVRIDALKNAL